LAAGLAAAACGVLAAAACGVLAAMGFSAALLEGVAAACSTLARLAEAGAAPVTTGRFEASAFNLFS